MKQKLSLATVIAGLLIGMAVGLHSVGGSDINSDEDRRAALRSLLLDNEEIVDALSEEWSIQAITSLPVESDSELSSKFSNLITAAGLFKNPASGTMLNAILEVKDGEAATTVFLEELPDSLLSSAYEVATLSESSVDQLIDAGLSSESDVRLFELENGERIITLLVSEGCASLQGNCILWTGGPLEPQQLVGVAEAQLTILLEGRTEDE